ncbi:hypothetical protein DAEQUDRAFT_719987 [Daedalea quercina L-15889]|uniref:N-acetyltransferase domain-containing protein n=1 Tax=Daedalea quercina L-15889 TaxID=1314783 RepID=A0A165UET3_9APHY|nr:hypothetical protein DAEQUDRAFT_719987 [Daedalea quercina L-15889]
MRSEQLCIEVAAVRCLRLSNIPNAITTCNKAFEHDPRRRYLEDTPDARDETLHDMRTWYRPLIGFQLFAAAVVDRAWCINRGDSIATYGNPTVPLTARQILMARLMTIVAKVLMWLLSISLPAEQNNRLQESEKKMSAAIQNTLGDRTKEMLSLNLLATAPESQGHGYATALVRAVTSEADSHGRCTWLISSNYVNTVFYEGLGFVPVREIILGDENPTWNKAPVVMLLMVREPQIPDLMDEKVALLLNQIA